jgi:hypothetical protein
VHHPSEGSLKRFTSGTASGQERKAVVAHLLKGCTDCSRKLKSLIEPEPVAGGAYDEALARFDRELLELLDCSIDPGQTLRTFLGSVLPPWNDAKGNGDD